jgi:hypothetical protein
MCQWDITETIIINNKSIGVDKCIVPLVKALNESGLTTIASCCGHGKQPTSVILENDRRLVIYETFEDADIASQLFPPINPRPNEWKYMIKRFLLNLLLK